MVDELEGFKDLNLVLGMFSAIINAAYSTQNHPKLPKIAKIYPKTNLKFHQKSRFWYFSKLKKIMCRGGTRACFHCLNFQSKNFSCAIFNVKKWPLYVNFSIPPCGN
jgi:hypothetical protein